MLPRFAYGLFAVLLPVLVAASAGFGATVDPVSRTVSTSNLAVQWSLTNPEEVVALSWKGSPNLTQAWAFPFHCSEFDHEFFGNSWVTENDAGFAALVGWGTTGTWSNSSADQIRIGSSASGCFGTSGVPVQTRYSFFDGIGAINKLRIQRQFSFGTTAFDRDFRPYIPRLYPQDAYSQVLHPNADGTALVTETTAACEFGCLVTDWDGTWFATHDPAAGRGVIVRHGFSSYGTAIWVDQDGGSFTNSSSVALRRPPGGFTGGVTDVQFLCFYDGSLWTPGLSLPDGC